MNNQNFGFCRGCGRQIIWTITPAGKNMPCDTGLIDFIPDAGPETFITPFGETKRGRRFNTLPEIVMGLEGGKQPEKLQGYIPHWVTCPQRDKFKKEKGK